MGGSGSLAVGTFVVAGALTWAAGSSAWEEEVVVVDDVDALVEVGSGAGEPLPWVDGGSFATTVTGGVFVEASGGVAPVRLLVAGGVTEDALPSGVGGVGATAEVVFVVEGSLGG